MKTNGLHKESDGKGSDTKAVASAKGFNMDKVLIKIIGNKEAIAHAKSLNQHH